MQYIRNVHYNTFSLKLVFYNNPSEMQVGGNIEYRRDDICCN